MSNAGQPDNPVESPPRADSRGGTLPTSAVSQPHAGTVPQDAPPAHLFDSGAAGRRLGRYTLLAELGRGGMGVVYRAHDAERNRTVALKTMRGMSAEALARFKLEFRSLTDITHPNLVALYEMAVDGLDWFFTMELVEGGDLRAHLGRGPARDWERVRAAFAQLTAGVAALHRHGMIHRDLKPGNVRVSPAGRVAVLDFGLIADLAPDGTHASTEPRLAGTVAFMSPEQAAMRPLTPATDWYSVGVMLYEVATGRLPHTGALQEVLTAKATADPPPPGELAPDVPAWVNELCAGLLRRDPAARAGEAECRAAFGAPAAVGPARPTAAEALVGRGAHLRALQAAFDAVRAGRPAVVLVMGPSGVGKTALLRTFLGGATAAGAVVLRGQCYEQEAVPFKAFDKAIDALAGVLAHYPEADAAAVLPRDFAVLQRVFPVLRRVPLPVGCRPDDGRADAHEVRRRAFAALRELLARLGDRVPLVVAIDDLQWGDVDSAWLLAEVLAPPDPPAALFVGCCRSEEAEDSPFLRTLREPGGLAGRVEVQTIAVGPLSAAESTELAAALLAATGRPVELAGGVADESAGSPFLIAELVESAELGRGAAPAGRVWDRVCRLSPDPRALVTVLAVAGRPIPDAIAARAADLTGDVYPLALELKARRLARASGAGLTCYHDRIRESILDALPAAELAAVHRRVAAVLEEEYRRDGERFAVGPDWLAAHFDGGGERRKAAAYYREAAGRARALFAFDQAARYYARALEVGEFDAAERRELLALSGDALADAGRGAEAARDYLLAADGQDTPQGRESRRRAGLQLLSSGHVDEGIRTLRPLLEAADLRLASSPRRALVSLLWCRLRLWLRGIRFAERPAAEIPPAELARLDTCWSVTVGLTVIDPIRGAEFQARGLLLALRAGEPARVARSLALEGAFVGSAGGGRASRRGLALLDAAAALADRAGQPYAVAFATWARGVALFLEGSWKGGLGLCDRAAAEYRANCVGANWELDSAHTFALWCLNFLGEWAELTRRCHALREEARARGALYLFTNVSTFNMATVYLAADAPDDARASVEGAIGEWTQSGYHVQHHNAMLARVAIELYCGRASGAWERIAAAWRPFWNSLLGALQNVRTTMRQMRAYSAVAVAAGTRDHGRLLRTAETDARKLEREQLPWPAAHATYVRAAVAHLRGRTADARRLLAEAAAAFEAVDMGLYAAVTRRRLGELTGDAALVARANDWMTAQGVKNPTRITAAYAPGFPDAR